MIVQVDAPAVTADMVWFAWRQSAPNPFQTENGFFLRYDDLDLTGFAPELFYEIFLALQLRVFAAYDAPVEVVFPSPVPRPTADYWQAFHDADHVAISPLVDGPVPIGRSVPRRAPRTAAVFFGGGKDSTLAACMLAEIYGREQVLLVQFVWPMRDEPALWARLEWPQEDLMLRPARERLGFATRRVWTNYQAIFRPEGRALRPNLELYTAGALPLLVESGVSLCTFSVDRGTLSVYRGDDGRLVYRYARARPEVLAIQTRHYQRALGLDLTVTNVNLPITKLMALKILAERYPTAYQQIVMCPRGPVHQRWCYGCPKCALFAFFSLAHNAVHPGFDYDYFLRASPYIAKLAAYAESGVELTRFGNARWQSFFSGKRSFPVVCHLIHQLDLEALPVPIGAEASVNLTLAKALFGNRAFPDEERLLRRSFDLLGPEMGPAIAVIAAAHAPVVDELTDVQLAGNMVVGHDFDGRMSTKTASLDHLRDEAEHVALSSAADRTAR